MPENEQIDLQRMFAEEVRKQEQGDRPPSSIMLVDFSQSSEFKANAPKLLRKRLSIGDLFLKLADKLLTKVGL